MIIEKKYFELLKSEVKPALGCTEPVAIAYGIAKLKKEFNIKSEEVEKIILNLSSNILKNAMGVGIPGTGKTGIPIAASLGLVAGNSDKELEVLKEIKEEDVEEAQKFINQNKVKIQIAQTEKKLFIDVVIKTEKDVYQLIIEDNHTNVVFIQKNSTIILNKRFSNETESKIEIIETSVKEIYEFAMSVKFENIKFILDGAYMNKSIALEGLATKCGLQIGKTFKENIENNRISDDLKNYAVLLTAAASDARMSGCMSPVMTNSGSGNQGITVTLPVVATAERMNKSEEELSRALILSNLIAIHIKQKLGRLSALCGVIVSAIGAGCGIVFLKGGNLNNVYSVIKNMIGDISGIICDGAKTGCAMKVATVTESAFNAVMLSLNNIEISRYEGIIDEDIEKCINNLTNLGSKGMEELDKMILNMMISKENQNDM